MKTIQSSYKNFICLAGIFFFSQSLSATNSIENISTCIDNAGTCIAIWEYQQDDIRSIQTTIRDFHQSFSAPTTLSEDGIDSFSPLLIMNSAGDAAAIWLGISSSLGITSIYGATRPMNGHWGNITRISSANELVDPASVTISMNQQGIIATSWTAQLLDQGVISINSSTASTVSGWSTPVQITSE